MRSDRGERVMPMARLLRFAILILLCILGAGSAFASGGACFVVTPSGSGAMTGANWNNAFAGIPKTLVRGDIYYLADGSYGSYTFSTADSSTTTVEIRKAQSYDNCTSTGWNTSTMGSSQAVFATAPTAFKISNDYFILNGNGQQSSPGCGGTPSTPTTEPATPSDCGIRVDNSSCSGSGMGSCNYAIATTSTGLQNITLEYVEVAGKGDNVSENGLIGNSITNAVFNHVFGRNTGCDFIQWVGPNQLVEFSYWWVTNTSNSDTCHPQYESFYGSTGNDTEHDNVYRDINGSAVISFTAPSAGAHSGLVLYNNVFWQTSGGPYTTSGLDDGIIGVLQGTLTGMVFVQNTMINLPGYATGWYMASPGQSGIIENNLWYNAGNFSLGNGTWTEDHNSFLGMNCPGTLGTGDVCVQTSAPNPFVNWTSGNFNLASENADWDTRVNLGAPYTVDPAGTVRSTDRGAYQFPSLFPAPPLNLTSVLP